MFALCGCRDVSSDGVESVSIDCSSKQSCKLSDYFNLVGVCPLETLSDNLMGYITKFEIYNSDYYLLDFANNCVFQYGADGTFKRKISKIGRGPDEYLRIIDFKVNEDGIYLLDYSQHSILHYDHDIKLQEKICLDMAPSEFQFAGESLMVYSERNYSKDDYYFYRVLMDGTIIEPYIKRKLLSQEKYNIQGSNVFCFGEDSLFMPRYSNYIYSLGRGKVVYKLDFKDKTFPEEQLHIEDYDIYGDEFPYIVRENIYQNGNHLLVSYFDGRIRHFALYDTDKKDVEFNGLFKNDLIPGFRFFPQWQKGKYLIDCIDSYSFIEGFPELKDTMTQLKNIKDTDNPILVIYEMK